jgi:hypothetical protein
LEVGEAVSFQLDPGSQPGKRVAAQVARSTEQPVLEHVDPTQLFGHVVKPPSTSAAGILRYVPGPGKVQHLTFKHSGVCSVAADLVAGQPVRFKLLTDERRKLSAKAAGASASQHAVHAYLRATDVAPISQEDMVRLCNSRNGKSCSAGQTQYWSPHLSLNCAVASTVDASCHASCR